MSNKIKPSTSNETAARGIKRKTSETTTNETGGKLQEKKIKIACSLKTENKLLKKQNAYLKRKNEEVSKNIEMCLTVLTNPRKILALHDYILQRQDEDKSSQKK